MYMKENNIDYYRKKRGMSLSKLAKKSNVSKSYLSYIERNINQNPSVHIMQKIASALEIDLEALIGTTEVGNHPLPENEWLEFVKDLKASGIEKEQLHEFKNVIEYARWRCSNTPDDKRKSDDET